MPSRERHLERVVRAPREGYDAARWPFTIPAARGDDHRTGDWGMRHTTWEERDLVQSWRGFLGVPRRHLRHLVGEPS